MILVTGGLGMIGAHTARALTDLGQEVVVTAHRRTEVPSFLAGRVTVESFDVTDRDAFLALAERHDITDIVHLAGSIPDKDPVSFFRKDTTACSTRWTPGMNTPQFPVTDPWVARLLAKRTARPIPFPSGSAPTATRSSSSPVRARAKHATCAATLGWRYRSHPPATHARPLSSVGGSPNGSRATRRGRSSTSCPPSTPVRPAPEGKSASWS